MRFSGEYDMVNFHVVAIMGNDGVYSLMPKTCDIDAKFHFIGNKIRATYHAVYDNPTFLPDSIVDSHDSKLMAYVRPDTLPAYIAKVYADMEQARNKPDSAKAKRRENKWKKVLWDGVSQYLNTNKKNGLKIKFKSMMKKEK